MKTKPTIRDVAKVAGVSQGTVSRVINSQPYVNSGTQRRVLEVMAQLGYQPNGVAQSMRTKATRMVGFMIADVTNPVFGSFVKAAEAILHSAGYTLLLANTAGNPVIESELVTVLQQRRVDGLILSVGNENNPALISALRDVPFPVVLMDRDLGLPFDAVLADHAKGMYQATHHLLSLGHRRIALITASQSIRPGRERLKGFEQAHIAMGLRPDPMFTRSDSLSAEYGFREAHSMLTARRPPTAIIAGGNQTLAGVLKAVGMLGLKIPEQLSLITCDDTDLAALYSPPITVISRDLSEMGLTSAELLLYRLRSAEDGEARRVMLPTQTILRDSCAAPLGFKGDPNHGRSDKDEAECGDNRC